MTQPDSYSLFDDVLDTSAEGKPKVLANDMDMNGDPMTAQWVSGPAHGTLTLNGNGHFVYTPTLGYAGSDSFVYKVFDGTHTISNTTVSLTVEKPLPDGTPPVGTEYDRWLGPAPKRPFNPHRFHQTWRMFADYGNGEIGDDGIHDLDIRIGASAADAVWWCR